jgi:hypothetical protein
MSIITRRVSLPSNTRSSVVAVVVLSACVFLCSLRERAWYGEEVTIDTQRTERRCGILISAKKQSKEN